MNKIFIALSTATVPIRCVRKLQPAPAVNYRWRMRNESHDRRDLERKESLTNIQIQAEIQEASRITKYTLSKLTFAFTY